MNKKILCIGLSYHRYTVEIIAAMREAGHHVTFHEIQPRDLIMKTLRVSARGWYQNRLNDHHRRIISAERNNSYDLVLFIQVHQMSTSNLGKLRSDHSTAEFVLYNWDSLHNHDYRSRLHFFDRAYTFDPRDAETLGIHYLPLFCIPTFQSLEKRDQHLKGIYFVGNIVSVNRYQAIQAFKRYCKEQGIRFKSHMACTPVVMSWLLRAGHWPTDVTSRAIPHDRFIDMVESSVAVFDFANHQQSGYTMRTMENLCAGKKIITSNAGIVNEPFYSPDRVLVFEGLDFQKVRSFLDIPLRDPDRRFEEYYVASFARHLVEGHAARA
jgi:hypothetical protein